MTIAEFSLCITNHLMQKTVSTFPCQLIMHAASPRLQESIDREELSYKSSRRSTIQSISEVGSKNRHKKIFVSEILSMIGQRCVKTRHTPHLLRHSKSRTARSDRLGEFWRCDCMMRDVRHFQLADWILFADRPQTASSQHL